MSLALCGVLIAGCVPQETATPLQPPRIGTVTHQTFNTEILAHQGAALVLFTDNESWQCRDMAQRFHAFFEKYGNTVKFRIFHWNKSDDATPYRLRMLPTVVLYKNGTEVDRIRGVPERDQDRAVWNDDIDLWLLKNVFNKQGDKFAASYYYRFNDTAVLSVSNY